MRRREKGGDWDRERLNKIERQSGREEERRGRRGRMPNSEVGVFYILFELISVSPHNCPHPRTQEKLA